MVIVVDKPYLVYLQQFPNGKMYVGVTSQIPPEKRWVNGHGYCKSPQVHNAIMKYGWDNILKEVVASGITKEEAFHFEKLLIAKLQQQDHRFGYNLDPGGYGRSGYITSDETKRKLSTALQGKRDGEKNPFYGKRHTADEQNRMRSSHQGIRPNEKTRERLREAQRKLGTPIRCVETGQVYRSIADAAEQTGIPYCNLKGVIQGDRHSTHRTHWERVKEERNNENDSVTES